MKNITFNVSLDEANKIFKALGNMPFNEVYELIGKLNEQANSQLTKKVVKTNAKKNQANSFSNDDDVFGSHLKVR